MDQVNETGFATGAIAIGVGIIGLAIEHVFLSQLSALDGVQNGPFVGNLELIASLPDLAILVGAVVVVFSAVS